MSDSLISAEMQRLSDSFIRECVKITHEMCPPRRSICIGTFEGKRVALKDGFNMENEIEIYKKIGSHANIVQFIDEIDGFILMEGIKDGLTLYEYCRSGEKLSIKMCINLMLQLAKGIQHLHKLDIIHHDLKLENILVDLEGEIPVLKICDFEFSEILDEEGHGKESNRKTGTYHYMAPEQLLYDGRVTLKIDIYPLGIIFTDILFKGRDIEEVMYTVPVELLDLTERCKSKDPKDRPSIDEIIKIIEGLKDLKSHADEIIKLYQHCLTMNIPIPDNLKELYQKVSRYYK